MKTFLNIILFSFLAFPFAYQAQNKLDALKRQGLVLMKEGRYEEAVDQFNKFIASNPRLAEGYHLRGLCYEKRIQYQYSVLDLRRARRLDPVNNQIKEDLDRVIRIWHQLLYQKIDGHKRDIAIDPNYAFGYLEIGKSYRWLEEWKNAEEWYDEYLKRDDNASPDEIIRYTEILAKTGSIIKGERILKKYTLRYPTDWRIWSRYGYFTLWLGKNKVAEDAFNSSLGFKPYFKEAEDGLDLAKRQGYLTQYQGRAFERTEYPIDRYYRLLNTESENDQMRFDLISELITANRYEEAYQQLQYLSPTYQENEKYKTQYKIVSEFRDSTFNRDVNNYTEILKNNPTDKEAVLKLSTAYGNLFYYDSAIEVLSEYLQDIPEDQDLDARFKYSQYCAWNYEWEKAIAQIDNLLKLDPENLDYQLLRGQISVWTVNDLPAAEKYLLNVHEYRPNELNALTALTSLYAWKKNFQDARKYLNLAKQIAPKSPEVQSSESNLELHLTAYEESQIFAIKGEAGKLSMAGKCDEALMKYDLYLSKRTAPSRDELIEYGGISMCAKDYSKAIDAYTKALDQEFDYSAALQRAKCYYFNQNIAEALIEFENLSRIAPEDDEGQLILADAYTSTFQLKKAEEIYSKLKEKTLDDNQKQIIEQHILFLGEYYVRDNNFDKANSIFTDIQNSSKNPNIIKDLTQRRIFMADAMANNKNYSQSEELFDFLNKTITDDSLKMQLNLHQMYFGDILTRDKLLDEAKDVYNDLSKRTITDDLRKNLIQRKLYLADSYVEDERYGEAENVYDCILDETNDSTDIRLINQRLSWLPPSGLGRGFNSVKTFINFLLPTNISLAPFSSYYRDNQKFQLWSFGARLDAGFIGFLSIGASWSRTNITNSIIKREFEQVKGLAGIYFSKYLSMSGSYGIFNTFEESDRSIGDIIMKYEQPDVLSLQFSYESNDARMILYSPSLIPSRMNANYYRVNISYNYNNILKITANYNYFNLGDRNEGNDVLLRLGKRFIENGIFGYEYYYSDFSFISSLYYSPQNFESHSIWTEWNWLYKNYKIRAGGKIGYVPSADYIISEIYGEVSYNLIANLIITGRLGYGNSFRYDSTYKSYSASFSGYWSVF
ncbi:hypothetical protein C0389_00780 [bacterium]|nr:hypothetical protein [bacterium]